MTQKTVYTDLPEPGRLVTPEVIWPIAESEFARLIERWRAESVWLSLWNRHGEPIAHDESSPRFWQMLWSSGPTFRSAVQNLVQNRLSQETPPDDLARHSPTSADLLEACRNDLGFIFIPIRKRKRILGALIGGVVVSESPGEGLIRLCNQCGLDSQLILSAVRTIPAQGAGRIESLQRMLSFAVDQAREIDITRQANSSLVKNLEDTYEELNLIYRISSDMGLPQEPSRLLKRVGREVLEVSRAACIGFVLSEYEPPTEAAYAVHAPPPMAMEDRIVQLGVGAPTLTDLDRLAESLKIDTQTEIGHLLLNDAGKRREFEWAKPWLKHCVALPLVHKKRLLGVLLAINCVDNDDFTSVDVQLLRAVADRVASFLENQRLYDDLSDLLMGLLHALINSIDAKDPYTCGHSERVAFISRLLAEQAGLSPQDCHRIYLAGLLHDVGKIGIPDAILCKPGKLTDEEFAELRKHPEIGVRILSQIRQIRDLMPGVLYHHERMDGRGYPHGLAGDAIPMLGRILCLADCFDAMTTSRTYRAALPLPMAICEIRRCAGTQFDPRLADMFLQIDLAKAMNEAHAWAIGDPGIAQAGALSSLGGGWPRQNQHLHVGSPPRGIGALEIPM